MPTTYFAATRDGWQVALHRRLRLPGVPYRWGFEDYAQHDVPAAHSIAGAVTLASPGMTDVGHGPDEVYPIVGDWLDAHRAAA